MASRRQDAGERGTWIARARSMGRVLVNAPVRWSVDRSIRPFP
ncbi:hypothetical protein MYA_0400 [Burkholderia sp. KJ006]|nr:hypothetical protein MYA_0400 [Burkholderia sp. KJ006]